MTKQEEAHSPLPWFRGIEEDILDAGGFIIARADNDNAALILRAVNAYQELLDACVIAERVFRVPAGTDKAAEVMALGVLRCAIRAAATQKAE